MAITYEVKKIVEKDTNKPRRTVTATVEKIMDLSHHLLPIKTTYIVTYPVWDDKYMTSLVDTIPPCKSLDSLEAQDIAKALEFFSL